MSGLKGNVYVRLNLHPLGYVGVCRLCGEKAYLGDDQGPVHSCCLMWSAVILKGGKCPSCGSADAATEKWRDRQERQAKAKRWRRK